MLTTDSHYGLLNKKLASKCLNVYVTEMFDQSEKSMDIVFVVVLIKPDSLEFLNLAAFNVVWQRPVSSKFLSDNFYKIQR